MTKKSEPGRVIPELEMVSAQDLCSSRKDSIATIYRKIAKGELPPPSEGGRGVPIKYLKVELMAWGVATDSERASWPKYKKRLIAEAVRDMLKPRKETA